MKTLKMLWFLLRITFKNWIDPFFIFLGIFLGVIDLFNLTFFMWIGVAETAGVPEGGYAFLTFFMFFAIMRKSWWKLQIIWYMEDEDIRTQLYVPSADEYKL